LNQQITLNLIKRLIDHVEKNTSDDAKESMTEPADFFLCPQRFAKERQQFFFETPQVIGFAGEVQEPNSYATYEVMGIPILITRDEKGVLRAFVNACAHKGARVAENRGTRPRHTCKFHGWTYSSNGCLFGRPQENCFAADKEQRGLTALPISDKAGMLVVGLNPNMPQSLVDNHLSEIAEQLAGFELHKMHFLETRRYEVNANWKLIAGLSYESYHFATLHRDSVASWLKANYVADFFGKHSRWSFPLIGIEKLKNKPEEKWPRFVPGAVSHAFFPGTVMITNPEDAQLIRTEPSETPGNSIVYYTGVFRNEQKRVESYAAYDFGGKAFENEDLIAAIECQQGINAAKKDFPIGRNESVVQFWHKQWRTLLKE